MSDTSHLKNNLITSLLILLWGVTILTLIWWFAISIFFLIPKVQKNYEKNPELASLIEQLPSLIEQLPSLIEQLQSLQLQSLQLPSLIEQLQSLIKKLQSLIKKQEPAPKNPELAPLIKDLQSLIKDLQSLIDKGQEGEEYQKFVVPLIFLGVLLVVPLLLRLLPNSIISYSSLSLFSNSRALCIAFFGLLGILISILLNKIYYNKKKKIKDKIKE